MINSKNIIIIVVIGLVLYFLIKNNSKTEQMANTRKQKIKKQILINKIKQINSGLTGLNKKNIKQLNTILYKLNLVNNLSKLPNKYFLSDYGNIPTNSGNQLKNHIKLLKIKCPKPLKDVKVKKLNKKKSIMLLSSLDNTCINDFESKLSQEKFRRKQNKERSISSTRSTSVPSTRSTSVPSTIPTLGGSKSSDISLVRDMSNGGGITN